MITLSEHDWEQECEEKCNLDEGVGSPHMWVEETQDTQIWGESCIEAQEGSPCQHHVPSFDIDCSPIVDCVSNL